MRIIISGAAGQFSLELCKQLEGKHAVFWVACLETDITRLREVLEKARKFSSNVIINAATYKDVNGCERDKEQTFLVDAIRARNVAIALRGVRAKLVLICAGNLKNLKDVVAYPRYKFIRGDIANEAFADKIFSKERPSTVINFAIEFHVDRGILDPRSSFIVADVKGVQALLGVVRKYLVYRFIQISTKEVYRSSGKEGRFIADSPLISNSPYAASKAFADLLCCSYHKAYGVPAIVTRSSNNYGSYQLLEKLIPLMIQNALQGTPLPAHGKVENIHNRFYVEDNCQAIDLVVKGGHVGEIYNIGGGCKKNIEVVQMICDILEEWDLPTIHHPLRELHCPHRGSLRRRLRLPLRPELREDPKGIRLGARG